MPVSARIITLFAIAFAAAGLAATLPANANPGFAQASRMPCSSCHMPGQETEAPNAGFTPQGFQVYTSFRGACNYRMDCAIGSAFGTNAPPPPPQFGYGTNAPSPSPSYNAPPPSYGNAAPPPVYNAPPANYGAPPPNYGAPPPGYGSNAPPPGYNGGGVPSPNFTVYNDTGDFISYILIVQTSGAPGKPLNNSSLPAGRSLNLQYTFQQGSGCVRTIRIATISREFSANHDFCLNHGIHAGISGLQSTPY